MSTPLTTQRPRSGLSTPIIDLRKTDFNDVLQREGEQAIRDAIDTAVPIGREAIEPTFPDNGVSLDEAEQRLRVGSAKVVECRSCHAPARRVQHVSNACRDRLIEGERRCVHAAGSVSEPRCSPVISSYTSPVLPITTLAMGESPDRFEGADRAVHPAWEHPKRGFEELFGGSGFHTEKYRTLARAPRCVKEGFSATILPA